MIALLLLALATAARARQKFNLDMATGRLPENCRAELPDVFMNESVLSVYEDDHVFEISDAYTQDFNATNVTFNNCLLLWKGGRERWLCSFIGTYKGMTKIVYVMTKRNGVKTFEYISGDRFARQDAQHAFVLGKYLVIDRVHIVNLREVFDERAGTLVCFKNCTELKKLEEVLKQHEKVQQICFTKFCAFDGVLEMIIYTPMHRIMAYRKGVVVYAPWGKQTTLNVYDSWSKNCYKIRRNRTSIELPALFNSMGREKVTSMPIRDKTLSATPPSLKKTELTFDSTSEAFLWNMGFPFQVLVISIGVVIIVIFFEKR